MAETQTFLEDSASMFSVEDSEFVSSVGWVTMARVLLN